MEWVLVAAAAAASVYALTKKKGTSSTKPKPKPTAPPETDVEDLFKDLDFKDTTEETAAALKKAAEAKAAAKKAADAKAAAEKAAAAGSKAAAAAAAAKAAVAAKAAAKKAADAKAAAKKAKAAAKKKGLPTGSLLLGTQQGTCVAAVWNIKYCKATLGGSTVDMFQDWTLLQRVKAGRPKGMPFKVPVHERKPGQGPIGMQASDGIYLLFKFGNKYYAVPQAGSQPEKKAPPGGGHTTTGPGGQDKENFNKPSGGGSSSGGGTTSIVGGGITGGAGPKPGTAFGCGTGGYYDCD
jgi:hypothetical protein